MDKTLIFNFAVAMLAIVNPLGNLPLFLSYTSGEKHLVRNWLAVFIAITIAGLLIVFLIFGAQILNFFGITLAAFRISGGILLLLIGIKMIEGKQTKNTRKLAVKIDCNDLQEAEFVYSKILVPLGIPLFVGPGAISTAILYSSRVHDRSTLVGLIGVSMAISLVVLFVLLIADRIQSFLGAMGIEIVTRLFGLILAAIGVQFILNGLADATIGLINPEIAR